MRDDFSETIKRILAARVVNSCSNPGCRASTSGPQVDPTKTLNIGVAAHITAASPGGPRFDPTLTPEQRSAPENGVWLCQNCAKLLDNDPLRFPAALLREWKERAEQEAFDRIGKRPTSHLAPEILRLRDERMHRAGPVLTAVEQELLVLSRWEVWASDPRFLGVILAPHTDVTLIKPILETAIEQVRHVSPSSFKLLLVAREQIRMFEDCIHSLREWHAKDSQLNPFQDKRAEYLGMLGGTTEFLAAAHEQLNTVVEQLREYVGGG